MMPSTIRLGTCSPATQPTTAATLALVGRIAGRAAAQGIDILLLPEALVGGYPRGSSFGCTIGGRSTEGREEFRRHFRAAVDLGDTVGDGAGAGTAWVRRELLPDELAARADGRGGKEVEEGSVQQQGRGDGTREELERIARETGVFLVVGCIERAGGSLYCAVVYACPKLGVIGKRRKVQPTGAERLVWAAGSPATLRAVSTVIRGVRVNLAAAICWESYMPMLRQALYSQNINLFLAPTADGRDTWLSLMRTVGSEGRCFVVSSNMCVGSNPSKESQTSPAVAAVDGSRDSRGEEPESTRTDLEEEILRRRNSALTEEGFEIALPSPTLPSKSPHRGPRRRRRSVFDEDGNEIVLCCDEPVHDAPVISEEDGEAEPEKSREGGAKRQDFPRESGKRRSILDEQGNEIVLCCGKNGTKNGTKTTAKQATTEPRRPADNSFTSFSSRGGSSICSPFGEVLAGPQWEDDEGLIYADVDFEDCIRGRLDFDAGGGYSRNDAFKFSVEALDLSPLPY